MYRTALMLIMSLQTSPICYGESAMGNYSFLNGSLETFRKQFLEQVNKYRKIHGVHEIAYNAEINEVSQRHADVLASSDESYLSNTSYGESIVKWRIPTIDGYLTANYLYKFGDLYNYKRGLPSNIINYGPFDRMMNRILCFMGIGVARSKSGYIYLVSSYYPNTVYLNGNRIPSVFPPGGVSKTDLTPYEYMISETMCEDADKETYLKQNLECHNSLRKMHGVPPLTYNDEMNKYAQNKAAVFAGKDVSVFHDKKSYNEFSFINKYDMVNGYLHCHGEYSQGKEYSMNIFKSLDDFPEEENPAADFTQMIWQSTRYMGFGVARGNGSVHYVIVYDPPGNIKGYYKQNVFPDQLSMKSTLPIVNNESNIFNLPFILLLVVALVLFGSAISLHFYYYFKSFKSRNNRTYLNRSPMPLPTRNSVIYDECGYIN